VNRVRVLTALATVVVVLAAAQWGFAASIMLLPSSGGGVYDYELTLVGSEHVGFGLDPGTTITLSGLSGVTGASVEFPLDTVFSVKSFNPSSVVYVTALGATLINSVGTLVVDSSVLTPGTVDFSIGAAGGTTQGPVAAAKVPEPASLVLFGTALLGLAGFVRRKW